MQYQTNTLAELTDLINQELTVGCSFTQILPNTEIERIITTKAMPFFYQNYYYAVQKAYYFIDQALMYCNDYVNYKYLKLPPEIQSITWLWEITNTSFINIGINVPNITVGIGASNQPYLNSAVSTIGDLGVYKVVLDSFSDMMNQLSKFTVKYDYNNINKQLNILGSFRANMIAEVYVNIEPEFLFADVEFIEYATALCLKQMGVLATRYDYTLQGGIKLNGDSLIVEGKEREEKVLERIMKVANSAFFIMTKR